MARALNELSPLELLEDAVALLRTASASAWNAYVLGAVPFLLAIIYSVSRLSTGRTNPERIATGSFLIAIFYLWMSWSKSRFARRLLAQLSLSNLAPQPLARSIMLQSLAQGAKLIVLPLSAATILPFAWMVAFFRNAAVLADAESPFSESARMARLWQHQNWFALALLLLFGGVVFLNIAILIVALPFLAQTFSGYENEFTRNPLAMLNWTFFTAAMGLTWLVLDPILQAMYVVRCFKGESVASGADLRSALRRLASFFVVLVFAASGVQAREISPAELDGKIQHAMQKPEYAWRVANNSEGASSQPGWLDDVENLVRRGWHAIGRGFSWLVEQIRRLFERPPAMTESRGKAPPRTTLRWVMYALIVVIAGILFAIMRQLMLRRSASTALVTPAAVKPISLTEDHILASELPEDEWMAMAREALSRGDYRLALRAVYLANLAWLGRAGLVTVSRFKSNREYERELRLRSRSDELTSLFARNRAVFESAWYGADEKSPADFAFMEQNLTSMRALAHA
jgi:hypothetical protein